MQDHRQPNRQKYTKPKLTTRTSWKTIFFANSGGFSSKRIAGILGWLICLIVFVLGFVLEKEIPEFGDLIIIMSSSLLGIDSVTNMFQKRINR